MIWRVGHNNRTRHRGSCLVVLALIFTLVGCVPYPRSISIQPEIRGQLLLNGAPYSGASVKYLSIDAREDLGDLCSQVEATTTTDGEGRFAFSGKTEQGYLLPLVPVHAAYSWKLCFSGVEETEVLWKGGSYGPLEAPEEIDLRCELNPTENESIEEGSTPYYRTSLCRYKNLKAHLRKD